MAIFTVSIESKTGWGGRTVLSLMTPNTAWVPVPGQGIIFDPWQQGAPNEVKVRLLAVTPPNGENPSTVHVDPNGNDGSPWRLLVAIQVPDKPGHPGVPSVTQVSIDGALTIAGNGGCINVGQVTIVNGTVDSRTFPHNNTTSASLRLV